jgi:hypothetical protein
MKTIFALVTALFVSSAMAQPANPQHMFEFNADSVLQGVFSIDKSKSRGRSSNNDTQMKLDLNYAWALPAMRNIQLGARLKYWKGTEAGRGSFEDYGGEIGAIYNFTRYMQEVDLMDAWYTSLYLGLGWANTYTSGIRDDEYFSTTVAVGKRFMLKQWGLNHLVYTPEIAFENLNSTTGGALEYSQNLQLRFLQFAVFF